MNDTQTPSVSYYEAPSLRLSGISHFGGLIKVTEHSNKVIVNLEQPINTSTNARWKSETREFSTDQWNSYKHLILQNCKPCASF